MMDFVMGFNKINTQCYDVIVLHHMEWHGMAWHGMAWNGVAWNGMALHGVA